MTRLLRLTDTQHTNLLAILAAHRRTVRESLKAAQQQPRPLGPQRYPVDYDDICPPTTLEQQLQTAVRLVDELTDHVLQATQLKTPACTQAVQIKAALVHPTIDGCVLVLADHRAVVQRPDVDDVIVADVVEAFAAVSPAPITVCSDAGVVSVAPPEEVEQWTQLTDFVDTVYTLPVHL